MRFKPLVSSIFMLIDSLLSMHHNPFHSIRKCKLFELKFQTIYFLVIGNMHRFGMTLLFINQCRSFFAILNVLMDRTKDESVWKQSAQSFLSNLVRQGILSMAIQLAQMETRWIKDCKTNSFII